MAAAVTILLPAVLQAGTLIAADAPSGSTGGISGRVLDARGDPVAGVAVILCAQGAQWAAWPTKAFWQNRADTENCHRANGSLLADPLFRDPSAGDYSIEPGLCPDRKQGLTDPQTIRKLLERWKTEAGGNGA